MSQTVKCDICGFENPAIHLYCGRCGNGLGTATHKADTSILSAPIEGERKQVTIIFADISGFTALNDAAKSPAEVEQVVRLINLCLQELSEAIYEFDGYIDKYIGDAIMAVFGAPRAHEDDPERALRAALSMKERLNDFNQSPPMPLPEPLGIHIGINTGTVIAGMVGTDRKRSYTVMGDAVNVASRLEDVSERGEILISETTYNLTRRLFQFADREPVSVKGKREPLEIYELTGIGGARPKPPEAPIIGREYELETLVSQYRHVLQEQKGGSLVVVTGDAGLGKSRLISEFQKQVSEVKEDGVGPLWLSGRGLSYRQSFKNRLFVDILYSYLELPENPDDSLVKLRIEDMGDRLFGRRKNEIVPYLATLLGISLDEEVAANLPLNDPQVLQQRTFLAMGQWVEALVSQQPVVMVLEDLHWADSSSVDLIQFLSTLTIYNPVLMICVTRPERESTFWNTKMQIAQDFPDTFSELTLWPLTDEESRQVMKYLLKIDQMPAALEELLLSRAEGNPLFLEEVLRSLIEEGAIEHADGRWEITRSATEIDIPHTLQGVLTARIDRLEEEVKRVLQVAAVIGRYFPRSVLAPIINEPETLEKALDQLEAADLIEVRTREPEAEYMFKHVLTHETAYNSLLHEQRKVIHKQIADYMAFNLFWMLGEEYAPIVAEHYYKSETWPRAMRYLHRAAEAAIQSFANQEAVEFYNRALDVARLIDPKEVDHAALLAIHEGRANILTRLGEPQKAIADYEAMLAKAKDLTDVSAERRALNGLGSLHASHYDASLALDFLQKALVVARQIGEQEGIADTLNQLGSFYYQMGQLKEATACFQEAQDIGVALGDDARRIEAEDGLARIMLEQGETAASLQRYQTEIIKTRRRLGYHSGLMTSLTSILMARTFTADYKRANQTAEEALELQQRSGDLYQVPMIKYYHAFGQLHQGELGAAGDNLKEGLRLSQQQRQKSAQVLGMAWLSYYYLNLGLYSDGLRQAEQSTHIARELGSPFYLMRAQSMLGAAYRHTQRLDEAIQELEGVQAVAHRMGLALDEVMILYQLARAYIDANQWELATKTTERLLRLAAASDMKEFTVRGQWLQSIINIRYQRYDAALKILLDASDLAEKIDSRLSQYLIQIQKSYVYRVTGNFVALRDTVVYAQKIQKRLADSLVDEELRRTFLTNYHARHLEETDRAYADSQAKL
ncbi:MAG: tetratricopeptide repeat protein [Anaerolineae bacterium]|nr:tetratricopeptide repeat protein [Anaerolineae bacterium]